MDHLCTLVVMCLSIKKYTGYCKCVYICLVVNFVWNLKSGGEVFAIILIRFHISLLHVLLEEWVTTWRSNTTPNREVGLTHMAQQNECYPETKCSLLLVQYDIRLRRTDSGKMHVEKETMRRRVQFASILYMWCTYWVHVVS